MMRFNIHAWLLTTVASSVLIGCAHTPNIGQRDENVRQDTIDQRAKAIKNEAVNRTPGLTTSSGNYVTNDAVNYTPPSGTVSLNAQGAPVGMLLQRVTKEAFSVSFVGQAQASTPVTIQIQNESREEAIRQLASAAGYAAVVKKRSGRVMIATEATYVFDIPTTYLNTASSEYEVGGNTAAGGSGGGGGGQSGGLGGGGMGGGSSSGGSSSSGGDQQVTASFKVKGGGEGQSVARLQRTLSEIAGDDSNVVVDKSTGLVSITSTGPGLERAGNFIRSYADSANTRVSVHAAILQVDLTGAFRAGINWSKVVDIGSDGTLSLVGANSAPPLGLNNSPGGSGSTQDTSQLAYTSDSVSAVIEALRADTDVRVISQPSLIAGNGTPATLFSGTQLPYVGEVESNITGISGTATSGAELSYVLDGLSLSFIPDVVSNNWVNMQLVPALSRVNRFNEFDVNGSTLQGPEQSLKQVYLQLLAPTNKTVILGGSKQTDGRNQSTSTPLLDKIPILGKAFKGLARSKSQSQLVILLRSSVIPAPQTDPLVSQSI